MNVYVQHYRARSAPKPQTQTLGTRRWGTRRWRMRAWGTFKFLLLSMVSLASGAIATAQAPPKSPPPSSTSVAIENPFDAFQNFSAVMNGGIIGDHDTKIYRARNLIRTDFPNQYRVTDIDIPVTWVVFERNNADAAKSNHAAAKCARFEVADAGAYPFWGLKDFGVRRTLPAKSATESPAPQPAKEVIDGHPCTSENLTFVNSDHSPSVTLEMKLWAADDLRGFPVKIEIHDLRTKHSFTIRYSEVKLQPPDPNLFGHPADCGTVSPKNQPASDETPAAPQTVSPTKPQSPATPQL